jgi:hypothetical protein
MIIEDMVLGVKAGTINHIVVSGEPNGSMIILALVKGDAYPLTNDTNNNIKIFRSPKYLLNYIQKHKIKEVYVDFNSWNPNEIFDPHKRAMELRSR